MLRRMLSTVENGTRSGDTYATQASNHLKRLKTKEQDTITLSKTRSRSPGFSVQPGEPRLTKGWAFGARVRASSAPSCWRRRAAKAPSMHRLGKRLVLAPAEGFGRRPSWHKRALAKQGCGSL